MVWLRKKWTGAVLDTCTYLCVCVFKTAFHEQPTSCVPDYYTAIISGLSLALSPASIHLSCSFVKASVPNKAHSHAERMWGSTEWFQLTPQLHTASPSMSPPSSFILSPNTLRPPKNILALFFYFLHNVSLSFSIHVLYICHTQFVSLLRQPIRALCSLLHPEALGLNTFFMQGKENIFTLLTALRGAHCSAICDTAIIFLLMSFFWGPQFSTRSSATLLSPSKWLFCCCSTLTLL